MLRNKIVYFKKIYKFADDHFFTRVILFFVLRGSPHQSASKNRFFLLLQSLELLSENILVRTGYS